MGNEYVFRIRGRLCAEALRSLERLEPVPESTETVLVGVVDDRAALHGLIAHIEALGLELLGLQRLPDRPHPVPEGR